MRKLLLSLWKHVIPEQLKCHISRLLNHRFNVGLVGVFFDRDGKVLCFHHTYRPIPWGVPTGGLNRAEQPSVGLLREIKEESGLDVEIIGVHKAQVDRSRMDIVMVGRFMGGTFIHSPEVDNWGLFTLDALPQEIHHHQVVLIEEVWRDWQDRLDVNARIL